MILVVDNYDSFTYNLVQYVGMCGAEVIVRRNDEITLDEISSMKPSGIMLSPGPCSPNESGICLPILALALSDEPNPINQRPLFGVCLGHQSIGQVGGGVVRQAKRIMHGKASMVSHDGKGLFAGMASPFRAIRYHSLVVASDTVPPGFLITARSDDDQEIMGLRHQSKPIEGVQFHPESILTDNGIQIIRNFVEQTQRPAVR